MIRYLLPVIFFLCTAGGLSAKKIKVATPEAFARAIAEVTAGDEVIIANGSYSGWTLTVPCNGRAGKPVLVSAETKGKVTFTGDVRKPVFLVTGSYTEISGFSFAGCQQLKGDGASGELVVLKGTVFCRVTDCTFTTITSLTQFTPILVVSGNGTDNRVDNCLFTGNKDNQELQVKVTATEVPLRTRIDHNLFKDKPKVSWKNSNGGECVQVGQDPVLLGTRYAYTLVRDNRFVACNGEPEVISNKCSGNTYSNNTFENCQGELVMRGGHDCKIDSNSFVNGSGGIRINGSHHTVTNNLMKGLSTGIRLMYGMSRGKEEVGFYVAATDCIVSKNTIIDCKTGILVGDSKNADWTGKFDVARYPSRTKQDVPPADNLIDDNTIQGATTPIVHNE